jgi:TRAP transporter TAXI family solute receptor
MQRNLIFGGLLLVLVVIAAWVANPLFGNRLVFSTGGTSGAYYQVAGRYQPIFAAEGLNLELLPGAGSVETMERLRRGEADAGFVQGGVDISTGDDGLTSLGSMFYEVVWLFQPQGGEVRLLTDLQGGRVGIGAEGSGTRALALDLLADSGVTAENTTFVSASSDETRVALADGSLEAAFFVAAPGAPLVRDLFTTPGFELVRLDLAKAYSARSPYLTTVTLPAGLIDVVQRLPAEDTTVLAVTANLVVRRDLHPDMVGLLLQAATHLHSQKGLLEQSDEFPALAYNNLPINEQAERYLTEGPGWFAQNFPARLAGPVERLIGVALPLFVLWTIYQTLGPLYDFLIAVQVKRWYSLIAEVDRNVEKLDETEVRSYLERTHAIRERLMNTRLPFLYIQNLYETREHVELVMDRLEDRLHALDNQRATG